MKYLILLLIFFIISCNKEDECEFDKLTGDQQQLIGEWEWQYSVLMYVNTVNGQIDHYDTIRVSDTGNSSKIVIRNDDYLILYTNSTYFDEGYFKIDKWEQGQYWPEGYIEADLNLNPCNNPTHNYTFYLKGDTLKTNSFPYPTTYYYTSQFHIYLYPAVFIKK